MPPTRGTRLTSVNSSPSQVQSGALSDRADIPAHSKTRMVTARMIVATFAVPNLRKTTKAEIMGLCVREVASRTSSPARAAGLGQPPNRHSNESHGESSVIGPIGLPAQNIVCAWIIASPILTSRSSSPFRPMLCAVTRAPSSSKNSSSASISGSASDAAAHS